MENSNYIYVKKSKSTALLLCLIGFLGVAGLHRIYTGHIISGIIYLLTGGLFGIGTIIDLLYIILGFFYDKFDQPLV